MPELLNCLEFVNADNIAKGLSPFNVEKVAFEAGRIMLVRIDELLRQGVDFAVETTLSSKSYISIIKNAKSKGYAIRMLYIWLESAEVAVDRVATRVEQGGHNIPEEIIRRRYERGLQNLFKHYIPIVDSWTLINNTHEDFDRIAHGENSFVQNIENNYLWNLLNALYNGTRK